MLWRFDGMMYLPLAGNANEQAREKCDGEWGESERALWKYFTPRRHDGIKLFVYGSTENELYDMFQFIYNIYIPNYVYAHCSGDIAREWFSLTLLRADALLFVCGTYSEKWGEKNFYICLLSTREERRSAEIIIIIYMIRKWIRGDADIYWPLEITNHHKLIGLFIFVFFPP